MFKFYAIIMNKLTRALYGAYVIVAERKDATATITETVPRQHSGSGNSIEIPMQRRSVRNMTSRDGGVISDTEFPHVGGKAKEGRRASTISDSRRTRVHLIHHTTCIRFVGHRLGGYTFEACKQGRFGFGAK